LKVLGGGAGKEMDFGGMAKVFNEGIKGSGFVIGRIKGSGFIIDFEGRAR
jgi:hypothetical protein